MRNEWYQPDRNSITDVNIRLTREDDGRLVVRLSWDQNEVPHQATVEHRLGVEVDTAVGFVRDALWQMRFWHTTIDDVYAAMAGEGRGLSVER